MLWEENLDLFKFFILKSKYKQYKLCLSKHQLTCFLNKSNITANSVFIDGIITRLSILRIIITKLNRTKARDYLK